MTKFPNRRLVLLGGVSAAALISLGLTAPDYFHSRAKEGAISFEEAKAHFGKIVDVQLKRSADAFGISYTAREAERVHEDLWDGAKLTLSEVYKSKEDYTKNESEPMASGVKPNGGIAPTGSGTTGAMPRPLR